MARMKVLEKKKKGKVMILIYIHGGGWKAGLTEVREKAARMGNILAVWTAGGGKKMRC